ncbi:hypothetical protein [Novosphingobium terrae]|uniref:hypothetical protein n=1 Tax=Novosphingobium terrae TaxID=2726189 RepID=UPI00197E9D91|nr:hypothetical protein [Novosphingobium terrae]
MIKDTLQPALVPPLAAAPRALRASLPPSAPLSEAAQEQIAYQQGADLVRELDHQKTLHDLRGTYATKLMTLPGGSLTNSEIASVMGWSETQVATIRKRYVDEAAIVVAIGRRIAGDL